MAYDATANERAPHAITHRRGHPERAANRAARVRHSRGRSSRRRAGGVLAMGNDRADEDLATCGVNKRVGADHHARVATSLGEQPKIPQPSCCSHQTPRPETSGSALRHPTSWRVRTKRRCSRRPGGRLARFGTRCRKTHRDDRGVAVTSGSRARQGAITRTATSRSTTGYEKRTAGMRDRHASSVRAVIRLATARTCGSVRRRRDGGCSASDRPQSRSRARRDVPPTIITNVRR